MSSGSIAGNIADSQLVAAEFAVRLGVHDPVGAQVFATAAASTSSEKSMVPTTCERNAGSVTNGVANSRPRPSEYSRCEESAVRVVAQSSPPLQHPVELFGQHHQRADRRGVVGLVLAAVSTAMGSERKSGTQRPDPAIASMRASAAGHHATTVRRRRRSTSAGRSSRRRSRRCRRADRRRRRSRRCDQASPDPAGRTTGTATPVEVSLCAQPIRSTDGSACGFGALPGSALTMIGSPTNGFFATHGGELAS